MDTSTEDSKEKGTNGIAYIVILIFIIIGLLVASWVLFFAPPLPESPAPPDSDQLLAEVLPNTGWSDPMNTSECMKFTFTFPEQPTLDPTVLDNMQGIVTNISNICPFDDEIGAQKYTRTCLDTTCIDDDGVMYTNGDVQTLYRQCLLNDPDCDKTLALISIGFDPSNPDTNVCITQTDDGSPLFLSSCDPSNSLQLFVIETFNTQFARITNKADLCVLPISVPVMPGMEITLQGCAPDQYNWDLLNGKRYQIPSEDPNNPETTVFVPQQLIFWDQSTQGTVPALNILNMNLLSMSVGPSNSLILNPVSIDGDEGDSSSAQILDYALYDFILTQNTIPVEGESIFPFYTNLPDILAPNGAS